MKTKLLFVGWMLFASMVTGQNNTFISQNNPGEIIVTPPTFVGNKISINTDKNSLINEYLTENVQYPPKAKKLGYEGTEIVQFTVTENGDIIDFKVINSICYDIDNEVIKALISTKGMWKPGYNNEIPVSMSKEVSMVFFIPDVSEKSQKDQFKELANESFKKGTLTFFVKKEPKKALRHYNQGLNYLPYDKSLLLMRGLCKYELGDQVGAVEDWNRMTNLGEEINMNEYSALIENTKGYNKLMAIMNK